MRFLNNERCQIIIVLEEIEERREFLDHMEALGKGKQVRSKILTEISMVSIDIYENNLTLCKYYNYSIILSFQVIYIMNNYKILYHHKFRK